MLRIQGKIVHSKRLRENGISVFTRILSHPHAGVGLLFFSDCVLVLLDQLNQMPSDTLNAQNNLVRNHSQHSRGSPNVGVQATDIRENSDEEYHRKQQDIHNQHHSLQRNT
eukprot:TRINITY_DN8337_c0_g1_i6.p1 TRINITY_DN8337_c0_g1~~TRINITY_DN8337_c0_g1_i6.p1  ORF type:complete len:111 (-),score=1.97 TRINITY_DN8337_c0_g1_i6:153-485(-)